MNKRQVGSDPTKFPTPDLLSPSCDLPHAYWKAGSCEEATHWGELRTTWNAIFSRDDTVRAHCLNSPKLNSKVRWFLVDQCGKDDRFYSTNGYLLQALAFNPDLTKEEVTRFLSESKKTRQAIAGNKAAFDIPDVMHWVLQHQGYLTEWLSEVQGLSAYAYEYLARDKDNWYRLATNCDIPDSLIRKFLAEGTADVILAVLSCTDTPIDALFEAPDHDLSDLKDLFLEHLTQRADEANTWIADNCPEMLDMPYEWVREVTAAAAN